jgi:hypothetical protein
MLNVPANVKIEDVDASSKSLDQLSAKCVNMAFEWCSQCISRRYLQSSPVLRVVSMITALRLVPYETTIVASPTPFSMQFELKDMQLVPVESQLERGNIMRYSVSLDRTNQTSATVSQPHLKTSILLQTCPYISQRCGMAALTKAYFVSRPSPGRYR